MNLLPGDIVERYTVERLLGQGGMAVVYRVRHNTLGSVHALKVLAVSGVRVRDRLLLEGRVQSRLRHANIVSVTDVLDVQGAPGLLMDCVEGPTLDVWLHTCKPDLEEIERLFLCILAGVERAHALGVIHRDLKPVNVLVDPTDALPVPRITDFGLAKALGDDASLHRTHSGVAMGTPSYMAPEQFRDASTVDHRADIFSLGCILYEMVCGRIAFPGADFVAVLTAVVVGRYVPPREIRPDLPERMVQAIGACLEVDRDRRVGSCADLRRLLKGDGVVVDPPVVIRHPPDGSATEGDDSVAGPLLSASQVSISFPDPPEAGIAGQSRQAERKPRFIKYLGFSAMAILATGLLFRIGGREPPAVEPVSGTTLEDPSLMDPEPVVIQDPPVKQDPVPAPTEIPAHAEVSAPTTAPVASERIVPSPAPVSAPTPAIAPAETSATVTVEGSTKVWLEAGGRRFPVGKVPPGTYAILAQFESGRVKAGTIHVAAGDRVILRCDADFQQCRP